MSASAASQDDTIKLGLLMESAHAHQNMVADNLQRLQSHVRNLDAVVRDEIRRTLVEELKAVSIESEAAANSLRRIAANISLRISLTCIFTTLIASAIPAAILQLLVPARADIDKLRQQEAVLSRNIAQLKEQGGRIEWHRCGEERRLCVRVERKLPAYGGEADYLILKGY